MNKIYERISHTHCWNQRGNPPCGQLLQNHKQCCLCDTPYEPKKEEKRCCATGLPNCGLEGCLDCTPTRTEEKCKNHGDSLFRIGHGNEWVCEECRKPVTSLAEWEEEFSEKFLQDMSWINKIPIGEEIKSFIHSLLKEKEKKLEEAVENKKELLCRMFSGEPAEGGLTKEEVWQIIEEEILSLIKGDNE